MIFVFFVAVLCVLVGGDSVRLIVFGASGKCGSHLVRLAAQRGHTVTAVVRESTSYDPPVRVSVVRGDVLASGFVASVIPGHDAVASCLGIRYAHPWARRESPDDFISRATSDIVSGMTAAGVQRVSVISAAGVAAFMLGELEAARFADRVPIITGL